MFLRAILVGIFASGIVLFSRWGWEAANPYPSIPFLFASLVIIFFLLIRFSSGTSYSGVSDLVYHIHSTPSLELSEKWSIRGIASFLLATFRAPVGPEGAAIEWTHAFQVRTRPVSSHWLELQRRTDTACSLAAAISAAFHAPLAAIILPLEMRLGGRMLNVVMSSLAAYATTLYLEFLLGLKPIHLEKAFNAISFDFTHNTQALSALLVLVVLASVFSVFGLRFLIFSKKGLAEVFRDRYRTRIFFGASFLVLIAFAYQGGFVHPVQALAEAIDNQKSSFEMGLLMVSFFLGFSLVLGVFGSAGLFWPIYSIGGLFGTLVGQWIPGLSVIASVASGSAFLAAALSVPITATLLSYELTGNFAVAIPCLIAAFASNALRKTLRHRTLVEEDLEARGIKLESGRSQGVLTSIHVKDVMVNDHTTVHEHEPVPEIFQKLNQSKYPFLVVVTSQNKYVGMLTANLIEDAFESQRDPQASETKSSVAKLLEAKDLLYRSGIQIPSVESTQTIGQASSQFEETPVVPVVDQADQVTGLLFSYSVRIAYDREIARRAFHYQLAKHESSEPVIGDESKKE